VSNPATAGAVTVQARFAGVLSRACTPGHAAPGGQRIDRKEGL